MTTWDWLKLPTGFPEITFAVLLENGLPVETRCSAAQFYNLYLGYLNLSIDRES
jgi:hypothetical protein